MGVVNTNPRIQCFKPERLIKSLISGFVKMPSAPKGSSGNIVGRLLNYTLGTVFKTYHFLCN